MNDSPLLIDDRGAVRVITLHRPERLNALDSATIAALHAAADAAAEDPSVRVVVLTGAGMSAESGIPTFRDAQVGSGSRERTAAALLRLTSQSLQLVELGTGSKQIVVNPNVESIILFPSFRRHCGRG